VNSRPSAEVLAEFGVGPHPLHRFRGGAGRTWGVGTVVLKPVEDVVEAEWVGSILCDLPERGFRVSRPVMSGAGHWTVGGWSAWTRLEGTHNVSTRWSEVLAAAEAFHVALRDVARPGFLDHRESIWCAGDRAAWNDGPPQVMNASLAPIAEQLDAFRSPSQAPGQIIHGDLTGNVLFARSLAPAIIDFAPYWRPASFGSAVVVADAIAWHKASPGLTRLLSTDDDPRSMLARAAIFRLIASDRAVASRPRDHSAYLQDNVHAHSRILAALRSM
jgi:uncharacterized protein (TIGR02569 family)